ncbi:MAG: phenylalanine--tRNA ligase subunit alpha, partial [Ilumatobacteraceae bacterium]
MTPEIDEARGVALSAITQAETVADLERVVAEHLGKRGALAGLKKGLGGIDDPEARRAAGAAMHAARPALAAAG